MMKFIRKTEYKDGSLKSWMITTICLIVVCTGLIVLSIWLYMNYKDQKENVDNKVAAAVTVTKKTQVDADEVKFAAREKLPYKDFAGPDDYGTVTFQYPKTWSAYVANDGSSSGSTYQAYLNPVVVPPVGDKQQFALRVTIEQKSYDSVVSSYSALVKKGKLTSSSITVNSEAGTRLDGNFTDNIRGSAVLFKIRDKTLTVRTDADTFSSDFNTLVQTIKFNS